MESSIDESKPYIVGESGEKEIETEKGLKTYKYEYPKIFSYLEIMEFETDELKDFIMQYDNINKVMPNDYMKQF